MKIKVSTLWLVVLLFVLGVIGFGFLYFVGNSQLEEAFPSFQFFADSNTYIKTYRGEADNGQVVRVDGNYLGPLMVLSVFHGNNYLILAFNFFIFAFSVIRVARDLSVSSLHVVLLLLISPLTISSLLSVNKEVFLYPFLALALSSYLRKSAMLFLIALCVSFLVRWQLGVFYVSLILIVKCRAVFKTRELVLLGFLIAISVVYLLIRPIIEPVLLYVQLSNESYEGGGSGLFERVVEIQNAGLYFLIFPIKAFHLLFGMGFKFDKIFNPVDLYNDFFVSAHCAISFVVFFLLICGKKISMASDLVFVATVFLIVFCVTPIYAPRYLYFVFVLGVLVLAGAPADLNELRVRKRSVFSL